MPKLSRRKFLRLGIGTSLVSSAFVAYLTRQQAAAQNRALQKHAASAPSAQPKAPSIAESKAPVSAQARDVLPTRVLGETGLRVSLFGLGGASSQTPLSNGPHQDAVAIVQRALDLGVNYFDTASSYGDGKSERAIGEIAKNQRARMIIASKTGERTYDSAMRELETSLKLLQTDHLDVWLMHHVSLPDRDTAPAFGPKGAIQALERAKAEKIVRFAGVSGHHRTDVLCDWLQRYDFDVLLTAINAGDKHHADSFIKKVLPVAEQRKVGVVAMKIPAYGRLLRPEQGVGIEQALAYSLSQRGVATGIIACDSIAMLEQNVAAARAFSALDAPAQAALESKTASYWREAAFYRNWT